MGAEKKPIEEKERLKDLQSYDILDSPEEKDFDDIVQLATMITGCPTSVVSFIDEDRQWFKAKIDVDEKEMSRDISFCSHAIQQDDVFVVENALQDIRFQDNPLVTGGIRLRFYAGAPIVSSNGNNIGTVCVIDKRPKILLPKQAEALKILSRQVTRLLEMRMRNKQLEKLLKEKA